jgi:hypothetical protein
MDALIQVAMIVVFVGMFLFPVGCVGCFVAWIFGWDGVEEFFAKILLAAAFSLAPLLGLLGLQLGYHYVALPLYDYIFVQKNTAVAILVGLGLIAAALFFHAAVASEKK